MLVQGETPLFLRPNRILLFGQTYLQSWNSLMDDFRCCNDMHATTEILENTTE